MFLLGWGNSLHKCPADRSQRRGKIDPYPPATNDCSVESKIRLVPNKPASKGVSVNSVYT